MKKLLLIVILIISTNELFSIDYQFKNLTNVAERWQYFDFAIENENSIFASTGNSASRINHWNGSDWEQIYFNNAVVNSYLNENEVSFISATNGNLFFATERSPLFVKSLQSNLTKVIQVDDTNGHNRFFKSIIKTDNPNEYYLLVDIIREDSVFYYQGTRVSIVKIYGEILRLRNDTLTVIYNTYERDGFLRSLAYYNNKVYFSFDYSHRDSITVYSLNAENYLDSLSAVKPKINGNDINNDIYSIIVDDDGTINALLGLEYNYSTNYASYPAIARFKDGKSDFISHDSIIGHYNENVAGFGKIGSNYYITTDEGTRIFNFVDGILNRIDNKSQIRQLSGNNSFPIVMKSMIYNNEIYQSNSAILIKYSPTTNSVANEVSTNSKLTLAEVLSENQENEIMISDLTGKNLLIKDISSEASLNQLLDNLKIRIALLSVKTKTGDFKFKIAR